MTDAEKGAMQLAIAAQVETIKTVLYGTVEELRRATCKEVLLFQQLGAEWRTAFRLGSKMRDEHQWGY